MQTTGETEESYFIYEGKSINVVSAATSKKFEFFGSEKKVLVILLFKF